MIRRFVTAGIVLAACCTVSQVGIGQTLNWADPMFSKLDHEFGVVPRGYTKTTVTVTNVFQEPVHIKSIESECVSYWFISDTGPRWLAPGEALEIDIGVKRPFTPTGFVEFWLDKPHGGLSRVKLHADVRRDLVFDPDRIALGKLRSGLRHEGSLVIKFTGDPDWKIKSARCRHPSLDARIEELTRRMTAPGEALIEYRLTVAVAADVLPGPLDEIVELQLADHRNETVTVAVEGTVVAAISSPGKEVTPLATLDRDHSRATVPIGGGRTMTVKILSDEEVNEATSFYEDYFVLRCSTTDGHEIAKKVRSSYGRIRLDIVDLDGDASPELVLITGRGRGCVRSEEMRVLSFKGEQLETRLNAPYSGYFGPGATWNYWHTYHKSKDGSTDIYLTLQHSAIGESILETPEEIPDEVERLLSVGSP